MELGITNKRVLITGSSRGIGAEIARQFSKEGCKLSLVARNENQLKLLFNEIGGKDKGHSYHSFDLSKSFSGEKLISEVFAEFSGIDIVIHNVGGGIGVHDPCADLNKWLSVWMLNIGIAIEINNLLIPSMIKNKWGRIIHISSINAITGGTMVDKFGGSPAYSCAKAYANMYTKVMSREFAKYNIIFSGVMPGPILVKGKHWEKLSLSNNKLVEEYLNNHQAIGRFGQAKEIAPFVLLLASQHASFAAGSIIPVDGGNL